MFNALLHVAIWLRATVAWLSRIARRLTLPVLDFAVAYGGFVLIKQLWASHWADNIDYYPPEYTLVVIPLYILLLMASSWLSGGYDRPLRPMRIVKGMGFGLLMLLAFYSLLDEAQRYSRMLLLTGSLWTLLSTLLIRTPRLLIARKGARRGKVLLVGTPDETNRVRELYKRVAGSRQQVADSCSQLNPTGYPLPATSSHLQDLIRIEHVEEVVFCGGDIGAVINLMASLRTTGVEYKMAPAEGDFIIGSDSILSPDDLYLDDLDAISTDSCRRNKRLFDVGVSLLLLALSPVLFWSQQRKKHYFGHCMNVLVGRFSWVGYRGRRGIFTPADIAVGNPSPEVQERLMLRYMRRYKTATDAAILLRNWRRI
jgi:hypothetical protein